MIDPKVKSIKNGEVLGGRGKKEQGGKKVSVV